jgi:hypothetical protein
MLLWGYPVIISSSYFHPILIFEGKTRWELKSRVEEHNRLHSGRLQPCRQIKMKLAVANAPCIGINYHCKTFSTAPVVCTVPVIVECKHFFLLAMLVHVKTFSPCYAVACKTFFSLLCWCMYKLFLLAMLVHVKTFSPCYAAACKNFFSLLCWCM